MKTTTHALTAAFAGLFGLCTLAPASAEVRGQEIEYSAGDTTMQGYVA